MSVAIKSTPPVVSVGDKVQEVGLYTFLSDDIEVGDGAVTAFTVPENTVIDSIIADVETAFDAGGCKVVITDSDSNRLMYIGESSLKVARPVGQIIGKEFESGGTITATVTDGSATAGSLKLWLKARFNSGKQTY